MHRVAGGLVRAFLEQWSTNALRCCRTCESIPGAMKHQCTALLQDLWEHSWSNEAPMHRAAGGLVRAFLEQWSICIALLEDLWEHSWSNEAFASRCWRTCESIHGAMKHLHRAAGGPVRVFLEQWSICGQMLFTMTSVTHMSMNHVHLVRVQEITTYTHYSQHSNWKHIIAKRVQICTDSQQGQANTWFNRTPEVVGAATKVSGWPLRMVSGDGNGNVVGGAVVLPGLNCMTLMAGRAAAGWVDDCASCTSSRCWMLSTDVATVVDGKLTTGATATNTWQVQHMHWKWVKSSPDKLNKREILPDNTYKLCTL